MFRMPDAEHTEPALDPKVQLSGLSMQALADVLRKWAPAIRQAASVAGEDADDELRSCVQALN